MRSRSEVGQTQSVSGKPITRSHEPTNISQMIADIMAGGAQCLGIRRAATLFPRHVALEYPFAYQRPANLCVEFVVKPVCQPAHLDPPLGLRRQKSVRAISSETSFLDIFGNDADTRNWQFALGHQHR